MGARSLHQSYLDKALTFGASLDNASSYFLSLEGFTTRQFPHTSLRIGPRCSTSAVVGAHGMCPIHINLGFSFPPTRPQRYFWGVPLDPPRGASPLRTPAAGDLLPHTRVCTERASLCAILAFAKPSLVPVKPRPVGAPTVLSAKGGMRELSCSEPVKGEEAVGPLDTTYG